MNARPLNIVRGLLRSGIAPWDIAGANPIGEGVDRIAYLVPAGDTSLVVKEESAYMKGSPNRILQLMPIRRAPTVKVQVGDITWEIQKHYTRADKDPAVATKWAESPEYNRGASWGYDLHHGNVGVDSRGRFVAFDW